MFQFYATLSPFLPVQRWKEKKICIDLGSDVLSLLVYPVQDSPFNVDIFVFIF